MWVLTPYGYTSAVQHKRKPRHVMVRARDELSLKNFCKFAGIPENLIYSDFPSDYPFRVVCKKRTYKKFLLASVDDLDYTNFKSRAGQVRPSSIGGKIVKGKLKGATQTGDKYVDVLHSIWSVTQRLTPATVKKENDKAWGKTMARWSTGGAWEHYFPPVGTGTRPVNDGLDLEEDEYGGGWPDATDMLDMTPSARAETLHELELAKAAGDDEAGDVLADWDAMDFGSDVPIADMTDEQFREFENGKFSL